VIYRTEAFFGAVRVTICAFIVAVLFATMPGSAFATASVTLAWQPSTDASVVGYNVYYGGASETYTNKISAGSAMSAVVSNLVPGATYYFAATAYDSTGLESPFSNEASYAVPLTAPNNPPAPNTNNPPTLNLINNLVISENVGAQTVNLSGISAGSVSGKPAIKITATTSTGTLIPAPKIKFSGANSTGTLTFTPKKNVTGTATIVVTINNGQKKNNTVTRTFTVTINPIITQPPTLNPISNLFITENAGVQTVELTGISPGTGITSKKPKLQITGIFSNPTLFKKAAIKYKNGATVGTLTFQPLKSAIGTTAITITANNHEKTNNLVTRTFTVTILASSSTTPMAAIKTSEQVAPAITTPPVTVVLTPAAHADGQFALTVSSSSDQACVIQASTNLVDWVPVCTNTPPYTYTDVNAWQFSQRFYRPVPAP
jgi:hypothetical protein